MTLMYLGLHNGGENHDPVAHRLLEVQPEIGRFEIYFRLWMDSTMHYTSEASDSTILAGLPHADRQRVRIIMHHACGSVS